MPLSASIAFDRPMQMGYAQTLITNRKERTNLLIGVEVSSFFLLYKVIFFAGAKSDISLAGSDIARLYLAVIELRDTPLRVSR